MIRLVLPKDIIEKERQNKQNMGKPVPHVTKILEKLAHPYEIDIHSLLPIGKYFPWHLSVVSNGGSSFSCNSYATK